MHNVVTILGLLLMSLILITAASPLDEEYQMVLIEEINIFTDHTYQRIFFLDKQLSAVSTQPGGNGNVGKEGLELRVHWGNGKESLEFRIYR